MKKTILLMVTILIFPAFSLAGFQCNQHEYTEMKDMTPAEMKTAFCQTKETWNKIHAFRQSKTDENTCIATMTNLQRVYKKKYGNNELTAEMCQKEFIK